MYDDVVDLIQLQHTAFVQNVQVSRRDLTFLLTSKCPYLLLRVHARVLVRDCSVVTRVNFTACDVTNAAGTCLSWVRCYRGNGSFETDCFKLYFLVETLKGESVHQTTDCTTLFLKIGFNRRYIQLYVCNQTCIVTCEILY